MKIQPECYPCILRMLEGVAQHALGEGPQTEAFLEEVRASPAFRGNPTGLKAPQVILEPWIRLLQLAGQADPLREVKRRQNELALALLPAARELLQSSSQPLREAVKLAALANFIDAMVDATDAQPVLPQELAGASLDPEAVAELEGRLGAARTIAYVGDNCGEAVFDRLLIETIKSVHDVQVTYVTRAVPALNDVTPPDVDFAGLNKVAAVIDNGATVGLPSTDWQLLSASARELLLQADLVLVKGVGNYELLGEEQALAGRATFLLAAKCEPICREHGATRGAAIICNR